MTRTSDLQGHWRRAWIKGPGFEDHTTHVHWMQCGDVYVDLRVPADLPDVAGAQAMAELPPEVLLAILDCEGFAGTIDVADSICTWTRIINWHGTPNEVDAGRMWFEDRDHLIEDGVHAEYRELWHREADVPHCAHRFERDGQMGILVSSKTQFALGLGPPARASSDGLISALKAGTTPADVSAQFSSVYAFGVWDGDAAIPTFCTNPLMCGQTVMERRIGAVRLRTSTYEGRDHVSEIEIERTV